MTAYKRRAIRGGHNTKPLMKPIEKARTSNLCFTLFKIPCGSTFFVTQVLEDFLKNMLRPMIMTTTPKIIEEYFW